MDGFSSRRAVLTSGAALAAGVGFLAVAAQDNEQNENDQVDHDRSLEWAGQGDEHAEQDCPDELGFWHWVLTPGGATAIEEGALLTVTFEDSTETTVEGYRPGAGGGAMHFDVHKEGGGTVESAVVTFDGGGDNPILTISDGRCVPDEEEKPDVEVETRPATDVNASSATIHGELIEMGGFDEVNVYFEWRAVGEATWTATDPQTLTEPGVFEAEIDGLDTDTQYEFHAVAEANDIRVIGQTLLFEKDALKDPEVKTEPATDVNGSTAMLHGELVEMGDYDEVDVYFEWRIEGETEWNATDPETLSASGSFSAEIEGLESGTSYEFRAIAAVNDIRVVGDIMEFTKEKEEKKQPDVREDVQFEAECRNDKRIKFVIHNDTKHELGFSYVLRDTSTGGEVTVSANSSESIWVKYEEGAYTVDLLFDGETIATADGEAAPECNSD